MSNDSLYLSALIWFLFGAHINSSMKSIYKLLVQFHNLCNFTPKLLPAPVIQIKSMTHIALKRDGPTKIFTNEETTKFPVLIHQGKALNEKTIKFGRVAILKSY